MGSLSEMEFESAPKIFVSAVPYVHGGSGLITSWECMRHTRKNIWQSCAGARQTLRELVKELILSSKTPEERVCGVSKETERVQLLGQKVSCCSGCGHECKNRAVRSLQQDLNIKSSGVLVPSLQNLMKSTC